LLIYTVDNIINILNITDIFNHILINQINFINPINDVRILYPFLYILCNNILSQYDLDLNVIISNVSFTSFGWRMYVLNK
jgi:hypothetical protein